MLTGLACKASEPQGCFCLHLPSAVITSRLPALSMPRPPTMFFALRSNLRALCLPSKLFTEDSISQPTQSLKQPVPCSEFGQAVQIIGWDGCLALQLNILVAASFDPMFPKGHRCLCHSPFSLELLALARREAAVQCTEPTVNMTWLEAAHCYRRPRA